VVGGQGSGGVIGKIEEKKVAAGLPSVGGPRGAGL